MPVQLRRGRAFVWPVECGALGIFQRKGSFLEAAAKGEERRVRSQLLVPTLLFFFFSSVSITRSIFLRLSRLSLYLLFGSLTSGQSHLSFSPSSPKKLKVCPLSCRWSGLLEMECAGFGTPMIRADRLHIRGLPLRCLIADSEATARPHDKKALLLFLVGSCWRDKRD